MSGASAYFRWPTLHAGRVVFVSEDDLWDVPLQGGHARRLTSGLGEASHPAFSPDGSMLAYVGSEEGTREIFVMDSNGGSGRQLTYLGSQSAVVGWSADGTKVRFRSNYGQFSRRVQTIYEVSVDGGHPVDLGLGSAHCYSESSEGRVLGRNADDLARWKRYRGGTAGALWVEREGEWATLCGEHMSGLVRPMWIGERVYFLNDEDGTGNICSCLPDGTDFQQHTEHAGFFARFATTDGTRIIYTVAGELWHFDPATGDNGAIEVSYASPRTQLNRKFVDAQDYLGGWALHPKGHSIVATTRGKLFTFGNWEGAVRQHGEPQGVRYRLPLYIEEGKRVVVVGEGDGEERLEVHTCDGSEPVRVLTTGDIGRATALLMSPDEKWLTLTNHRHELLFVEMTSGEVRVADRSPCLGIDGFDWSPDSRWVAYAVHDTWKTGLIRIIDINDWSIRDVTEPGFKDSSPCFDPEGRYLYFVSSRWFDPVYDSLFFEISFPKSAKPCVVTLKEDRESLFLQKPRAFESEGEDGDSEASDAEESGEKSEGEESAVKDSKAVEDTKDSKDSKDSKKEDVPEPVEIDFDGIAHRVEAFPVPVGHYGSIWATDEKVFWVMYETDKPDDDEDDSSPGVLQTFDLEKLKRSTFAPGITDFELSLDRKTLGYDSADGVRVMSVNGDGPTEDEPDVTTRKSGWIDMGRLTVPVEPRAEWRQMLREAWRLMRDHYWSADLCGIDWEDVWSRYSPMVERVASRSEFSDLVWTMQGELGTSHAYEYGGDYRRPPYYGPGMLAANFSWDAEAEAYRIDHIARGLRWEKGQCSPLSAPGVNAKAGEHLVAVNGRRLDARTSVNEALALQAGREIEVTLRGTDGETRARTIKAIGSEYGARYRDWVARNRERVHTASEGKLGYVHIPDMSAQGFAEFHRGFLAELRRNGMVVDVRNNGGGHVSQLILEKLARKRIGYDVGRWTQPLPYPEDSVSGPIVALTDENAGSDGDIFSHCFKLMKLGTLVGKRTWGGVVGIWPRHLLVDQSVTTQPEFAFWFDDVGFGVENWGTAPDVEVAFPPEALSRGEDPQLDAAIAVALQQLTGQTTQLPEFGVSPNILKPPQAKS